MERFERLKREQEKLSKKVSLKDMFEELNLIAACDINYYENKIIAGFIVFKNGEIIDRSDEVREARFPYKPGFLAYREAPAVLEAYYKLKEEPDIIIISRNGIMHPRRFGMTSHIGIALDKPVIGVSKRLLYGEAKEGKVYDNGHLIGFELETKENGKPIYVSPGNKVSFNTSLQLIKENLKGHKMPEYLHLAHKLTNKIKIMLKMETKQELEPIAQSRINREFLSA